MRSQTWTPLPAPYPQHLSGSSPCTSPKHAAPYVRHGLAIQFLHDSIHVRIPILPNHPTLSLSLWVQKSGIHICVFFPVLHTGSSLPSSYISILGNVMAITNNQTSGFHPRLSLLKNSPTLIHPNFRCVASLTKIFLESLPPFYTHDPYPRLHHSSLKYCHVLLNDLVSSIYPPMLRVII